MSPAQRSPRAPAAARHGDASDTEELCLLAPRQLSAHLRFVEDSTLPGATPGVAELAEFWRRASTVYRQLETSEAGAADNPTIKPLPRGIQRHVDRLGEQPAFMQTFDTVPVAFGMVELDKMIVSQYSLTRSITDGIARGTAGRPGPSRLAEICLPCGADDHDCRLSYRGEGEFVYLSTAHDLRFLGASLIEPEHVAGLKVQGHARAVIALSVGFSTNILNVVRLGNRVVLNNGHHRAYALRAMGLTHLPCVIQVCTSHDELREAANEEIQANSDLYFEAPRPPLLRDFSRAELVCSLRSSRQQRQVRLRITSESRPVSI